MDCVGEESSPGAPRRFSRQGPRGEEQLSGRDAPRQGRHSMAAKKQRQFRPSPVSERADHFVKMRNKEARFLLLHLEGCGCGCFGGHRGATSQVVATILGHGRPYEVLDEETRIRDQQRRKRRGTSVRFSSAPVGFRNGSIWQAKGVPILTAFE